MAKAAKAKFKVMVLVFHKPGVGTWEELKRFSDAFDADDYIRETIKKCGGLHSDYTVRRVED